MFKTYYIASKISVLSSHQLVLKLFQLADLVCVYVCIHVCVCVRLSGVGDVCVCAHVCACGCNVGLAFLASCDLNCL